MERTLITNLKNKIGQEVIINGWVANIRDKNKIKFVVLRDRTGETQGIAFEESCDKETFELLSKLYRESCVKIEGKVKESSQAKQGYEIEIIKMQVYSKAEPNLPIDIYGKIESTIDNRLDNRFLDTRKPEINAIFKIRSQIFKASVDFFSSKDFLNINTPKMSVLGLESGAELFTVDYFGKNVYLTQSPQLYKQMFVAGGFERVYEIGPVFRAEKSHTNRHLTEYTGIDIEMGFISSYEELMDLVEEYMIYLINHIKQKCTRELELLNIELNAPKKIPRLSIEDIREIFKEKGKIIPENEDLDSEGEKMISQYVKEKYGEDFVFATNYPFAVRPFYHRKNGEGTCSFDLIYNGVEIATGSQREHRLDVLSKQAQEKGLDLSKMPDYEKIFKFGCPPHGGIGFGLDRITEKLLKIDNIREAVLLTRDPDRYKP